MAVGARPLAITNCLNFGNPERPAIMGQLVGCIEGMAAACRALDFPVVSGNVSLYNETDGQAILPTPNVGGVGVIADLGRMVGAAGPSARAWPWSCWARAAAGSAARSTAAVIGAARMAPRRRSTSPPSGATASWCWRRSKPGVVRACHDLSDGGLAVAVAEMCLAGGIGAVVSLPTCRRARGWLFGEDQARYLLAVEPRGPAVASCCGARRPACSAREVGRSGGDALILPGELPISLGELQGRARGLAAGLHGGRDELTGVDADMAMSAAEIETADPRVPARRQGDDRGSGRRRRSLPRHDRVRAVPRQDAAAAASARLQGAGRAHGRASCMPWRLTTAASRPKVTAPGGRGRSETAMSEQPVFDRIRQQIGARRRRALHEGHACVPDVRLLGRRGPGAFARSA